MTFKIELVNVNLHDFDVRESDLYSYDFFEPYCLQLIDDHIELKNLSKPKSGGVFVDFVNGKLAWRRLHGGGNGQPIAKAVFSKKKEKPSVFDATGGLGRDAFVLASLGCTVTMFERNEIVRILLTDGLRRGYEDPEIGQMLKARLQLSSHRTIMELGDEKMCDVVYLDPMYPKKNSSALVKKDMQAFHDIVGLDLDADKLLVKAMKIARMRVSVKRPKGAEYLANVKSNSFIETKSHRFDIYAPNLLQP